MRYRPWGTLDWALSLGAPQRWRYVGALGTEDRSLCAWTAFLLRGVVDSSRLAEIHDGDSEKYRLVASEALSTRRQQFLKGGGSAGEIQQFGLFDELFRLRAFAQQSADCASVVVDITSLPKRFFFPILKELVLAPNVKNLIVAYSHPAMYAKEALYEDIDPWRALPGFGGGTQKHEMWIVSVGFLVEGLRNYVLANPREAMRLLIPYPAPPAVMRRTWQSVALLEQGHRPERFEKWRVDGVDMSAAFDRLVSLAGNPARHVAFAPFGPKPMSAAMCLFAMQSDASVHYAQPKVYHPHYSVGIRGDAPLEAVSLYWVKHEGDFLYAL